jgi:hypothetical protein
VWREIEATHERMAQEWYNEMARALEAHGIMPKGRPSMGGVPIVPQGKKKQKKGK